MVTGDNMLMEIGRLCVKIAGRDAGRKCVVVDALSNNYVLIDGQTRRRKCNIAHLEPLKDVIKIKKNASHDTVVSEFKKLNIEVLTTKPRKASERPKKIRKKKVYPEKVEKKPVKKADKEVPKTEVKKETVKKEEKPTEKTAKPKTEKKEIKPIKKKAAKKAVKAKPATKKKTTKKK